MTVVGRGGQRASRLAADCLSSGLVARFGHPQRDSGGTDVRRSRSRQVARADLASRHGGRDRVQQPPSGRHRLRSTDGASVLRVPPGPCRIVR
jgi:hypothetical protein